jgi:chloramphenicol-sensitive protein RarD
MSIAAPAVSPATQRAGVIFGLAAYGAWGLVPLYFGSVAHVPPLQVLAHRVIWSVLLLVLLLAYRRRLGQVWRVASSPKVLGVLMVTTLLIATNWYVFIWSVDHGYVLEASLGYFINPLVNMLLGYIFLGERLRRWQKVAVALAVVGVLIRTTDHLPWIALVLATSFGFYGLLRKTAPVDALIGLTVETALLAPAALLFVGYAIYTGDSAFALHSRGQDLLLMAAGVVTAVPLLWFANAARRLPLTTMGFLQYLAPTGHFLLAVFWFGEALKPRAIISFAFIWLALGIYSYDTMRRARQAR